MKKGDKNVRVIVENTGNKSGFDVFLDYSGNREYVMHHRHNGLVYELLKDGVVLDDLRRWKMSSIYKGHARKSFGTKRHKSISHLINVIEDYIAERDYSA